MPAIIAPDRGTIDAVGLNARTMEIYRAPGLEPATRVHAATSR